MESATAIVKSEDAEIKFPFKNDGNFLRNYLDSLKNGDDQEKTKAKDKINVALEVKAIPRKKSRFTNMFNQMKKTNAGFSENLLGNEKLNSNAFCSNNEGQVKQKVNKAAAGVNDQSSSMQCVSSGSVKSDMLPKTDVNFIPRARKKRSRWGEKVNPAEVAPPGIINITGKPLIQTTTPPLGVPGRYRTPGLIGCSELSDVQQKQLKEQREMQEMYNMIMASRNIKHITVCASDKKKSRLEYDSDEEIDEQLGTWEHQNRRLEMQKTKELAEKLTGESEGKHFIGDFLPPDQLEHFMETFKALKEGRTPDFSDYKDFKLTCDNIGFKMLEKMGWKDGEGLGTEKRGITAPINQGRQSIDGRGIGVSNPDALDKSDDEFSAYRKRMMLAYRFRPNPLNNPRRPYY